MKSDKISPASSKDSNDPTAFSVWGAIAGIAVGVIIGAFSRQWVWPLFGCITAGWIVGALIDRSRR